MSDTPQGPGWWLASDGRYYPPESAPGASPAPQPPAPVVPSTPPGFAPHLPPPAPVAHGLTTVPRVQHPVAAMALIVAAVAALVVVIAAFLTWASIEGFGQTLTIKGTDDGKDGLLTVVLGAAALVLALVTRVTGRTGRAMPVIVAVLGGLTLLIGLIDIADVSSIADDPAAFGAEASVGIGLWLTALGGLVTAAAGVVAAVKR